MVEEVAVLGGHEGFGEARRDAVIGDVDAPLLAVLADQGAVPGEDARRGHRVEIGQLGAVGHVVEQPGGIDGDGEPRDRDDGHERHTGHGKPTLRRLHHNPLIVLFVQPFTKGRGQGKAIARKF